MRFLVLSSIFVTVMAVSPAFGYSRSGAFIRRAAENDLSTGTQRLSGSPSHNLARELAVGIIARTPADVASLMLRDDSSVGSEHLQRRAGPPAPAGYDQTMATVQGYFRQVDAARRKEDFEGMRTAYTKAQALLKALKGKVPSTDVARTLQVEQGLDKCEGGLLVLTQQMPLTLPP